MAGIADLIPEDSTTSVKWAPSAQTRRIYDRNVYSNDTAFTTPPVVNMIGLPARVDADETTIFAKPMDAVMMDPSGTSSTLAGIWYADVIVSGDPDVEPNYLYVTMSHPSWPGPQTRIVPYGTTKICWTDLAIADPPDPIEVVFVGGTSLSNYSEITGLAGYPASFTPSAHNHTVSQITDFTEQVQDAVAAFLQGASGVSLSYNDAGNQLTITGGGSGSGLDAEAVRDANGLAIVGAGYIQVVVNDALDTITIQGSSALTSALAAKADLSGGFHTVAQLIPGTRLTLIRDTVGNTWKYNGVTVTGRPGARTDIFLDFIGGADTDRPAWGNISGDRHMVTVTP